METLSMKEQLLNKVENIVAKIEKSSAAEASDSLYVGMS